jgi:putative ABC transport system permease protein
MESMLQDLRHAVRALRSNPAFTAIAVLTLALGIGVNAAIFSVVYAVLLRPLPYTQPAQLALISSAIEEPGASRTPLPGALFNEIRQRASLLSGIAGIIVTNARLDTAEAPELVRIARVSSNFFQLLGVQAVRGRTIASGEELRASNMVVLSNGFWRSRLGGDPNIAGKDVHLQGGEIFKVLGALPEGFRVYFPPDSGVLSQAQLFYLDPDFSGASNYLAARLKPGVSFAQAQQEMNAIAVRFAEANAEFGAGRRLTIVSMQGEAVRDLKPALIALFAGAAFVLLICCVNVANLLLARANGRRKEVAIRSALGASQARILRQLLTESLLLCCLAGTAGLALGWTGIRLFLRFRPESLARMGDVGLNWPVLAFVAAVSLAAVLLFGLAPSVEFAKVELVQTLREGGRTSFISGNRGARAALIVGEVMLGFVLVVGAGLMLRTFDRIQRVRPGFEPQNLLTFQLNTPGGLSAGPLFSFIKDWETQLHALPGVLAVGETYLVPLDDSPNWYSPYHPEGADASHGAPLMADYRSITPGFLRAMGTRLLEGRYFNDRDQADSLPVVIVDDALANAAWPGQSAIGKKLESEHLTPDGFQPLSAKVVGVVESTRNYSLSENPRSEIYLPFEQSPRRPYSYTVRTKGDPSTLAGPIRRLLYRMQPHAAMGNIRPMTEYVEQAQAPAALTAMLAGVFGVLALALAAIGIYGVTDYSVSRRMHEMGVRMALGATGPDILRMVMREGLMLTAAGMILGTAGALAVSRQLQTLIYGISSTDPLTYALAIVVIPSAAMLGCWRPAARAAAANPVDAIRSE